MSQSTPSSRAAQFGPATKLLVNDHEKVEQIFEQIKQAESPNQRRGLVAQLDAELTRHTTIEETIVYPFVEENLDGGAELIGEAEKEHDQANALLERVSSLDPSTPGFLAAVEELEKAVSHHVEEEEGELFPKLERETDETTRARLELELEQEKLGMRTDPAVTGVGTTERTEVRGGRAKGATDVWVQPHSSGDDRWQVKREGAKRASRVFQTQAEAETFARGLAKREKVELVVAGRDGAVRARDSYGNDPRNVPG